ncbi:hypothetical protein EDD18DRAFT_1104088 [Armillaria luteobubalina]|uniref:Ser-Thr-rich glycosyl-phosphatidyl-inositol-anchored membrane family-domain-containing protein n=1 Tax=Armillaria luteobubalina TaxID=153913 RepID=A0AA39QBN5_9AGAR|nr:hypothetical protein EDD18DRAFT_1104088 [Armillaria luteobubalina]
MHFFTVSLSLLFAASTLAYEIVEPSGNKGWTKFGTNAISWNRVNTDAMTVANRTVLPEDQIITPSINGTLLTTQIYPPTGGWPIGSSFRLNFVKDPQSPHTILAQTSEFSITSKNGNTFDVSVDTSTTTPGDSSYLRTATSSATAASATSESGSSGAETTSSSASSSNGALPNEFSNNGLAGLLVLLGAVLF